MRGRLPLSTRLVLRLLLMALVATSPLVGSQIAVSPAKAAPLTVPMSDIPFAPDPEMESVPFPAPEEGSIAEEEMAEAQPAEEDSETLQEPAPPEDEYAGDYLEEEYWGEEDPESPEVDGEEEWLESPEVVRSPLSSRGGTRPLSATTSAPQVSMGDFVASIARQYEGFNYAWGGTSPRTGFDCSGFMWYVYGEAGVPLISRDLWGMRRSGIRIDRDSLLPGDLIFFENTYTYGLSHGGVYLGDDQFIHAVTEGVGVQIDPLEGSNWGAHYAGASRPW